MSGTMPYERFEAWKVSHQLALAVYSATRQWPRSELYGLTSQLRRAALSAPTNILDYSLGSLSELSPTFSGSLTMGNFLPSSTPPLPPGEAHPPAQPSPAPISAAPKIF